MLYIFFHLYNNFFFHIYRFLILDEADQLLSNEVGDTVSKIESTIVKNLIPRPETLGNFPYFNQLSVNSNSLILPNYPLQKLFFSATLSYDPEKIQKIALHQPILFNVKLDETQKENNNEIGNFVRPEELKEQFVETELSLKPLLLHHLIKTEGWKKTLIFNNSKEATHKLAVLLKILSDEDYTVCEFSSSDERDRVRIFKQFMNGKIDVLVSTDATARGLDVPDIEHVVSYEVTAPKTYIHRIGRTARAGKVGYALSIITKDQKRQFQKCSDAKFPPTEIEVPNQDLEVYENTYVKALNHMKETLNDEKQKRKIILNTNNKKTSKKFAHKFLTGSNMIPLSKENS